MFSRLSNFFVMYIAFRVKWYVVMYFFHILWVFLGKYPPCIMVLLVSVDIGSVLQVFSISSDIFCMI